MASLKTIALDLLLQFEQAALAVYSESEPTLENTKHYRIIERNVTSIKKTLKKMS